MHKKVVAVVVAVFVAIAGVTYPMKAKAVAPVVALAIGGLLVACGMTFVTADDLNRAVAQVQSWLSPDDIAVLETAYESGQQSTVNIEWWDFFVPQTLFAKIAMLSAQNVSNGDGTGTFTSYVMDLPSTWQNENRIFYEGSVATNTFYDLGTYYGISYSFSTSELIGNSSVKSKFITQINGHSIMYEPLGYFGSRVGQTLGYLDIMQAVYDSGVDGTRGRLSLGGRYFETGFMGTAMCNAQYDIDPTLYGTYTIDGTVYNNFAIMFADYSLNVADYTNFSASGGVYGVYLGSFFHDAFYEPYLTPVDVVINDDYLLGDSNPLGKDVTGLISDLVNQGVDAGVVINGNTVTGELADVLNPADSISVSIPNTSEAVKDATADDILTDVQNPPTTPDIDLPLPEIPRNIFTDKFPFCLPYDLYNAFVGLVATPTPPKFTMPMEIGGWLDEDIEIDFEPFTPLALICRWGLSVIFVIALIKISRKMIGAQ